jgi:hypothetical protein
MRHKIKIFSILFLLLAALGSLISPVPASAATGLVYISPGSASVRVGSSVSLALRINPGTTVDGVQATISYNQAQLQETAVDTSGSGFPVQLQKSAGGGVISLALGNLSGGVSSDTLVANLSFKALASSGSTSLTLSNVNATQSGSYTNPGSANGTVSFSAVPTSIAPTPVVTKPKITTKPTTTTPSTTPAAAQPVASQNVTINSSPKNIQYTLATIVITTNAPVQTAIQIGTDPNNLGQITAFNTANTTNSIDLASLKLTPGMTYYYKVLTKDAAGNTTISAVKSFKTKGYEIKVTVLDSHNQPLTNQTVTLHSTPTTTKTDSHGVATFSDVTPGTHTIMYSQTVSNKTIVYRQSLYVQNNVSTQGSTQTSAPQTIAVILPGLRVPVNYTAELIVAILIGIIVVIVVYVLLRKKCSQH